MLIALIGCDGSGKSSVSKCLSAEFERYNLNAISLNKWNILDSKLHPECRFISTDLPDLHACISEMDGPGRAFFLFFTLALDLTRTLKYNNNVDIVISDGYWVKHAASELIFGCPKHMIEACVTAFPEPDLVFYLKVNPRIALNRKGIDTLNRYECGLESNISPSTFLAHQHKVNLILEEWCEKYAWIVIDGEKDINTITKEIIKIALLKL